MGGNALKPLETRRVPASEYESLTQEVLAQLKSLFPNAVFWVPKAYHKKESFGDIDIVGHSLPEDHQDIVISKMQPKAHFKNSNVLSFEFKMVQVDLIHIQKDHAHFTYRYFCYNDLGGLLHVLSKRLGFYIGQAGLVYKCHLDEDKNQLLDTIVVSHDFDATLQFMGLSPERYAQGFETLEDIFQFVSSSRYFDPKAFLFENRNAHDRFRDQKRATYMKFLEWIEVHKPAAGKDVGKTNATYQLLRAMNHFPAFRAAIQNVVPVHEQVQTFTANVLRIIETLPLEAHPKHERIVVERRFFKYVASRFDSMVSFYSYAHVFSKQELQDLLVQYWEQYKAAGFPQVSRIK